MNAIKVFSLLGFLLLQGCSSLIAVKPTPSSAQELVYKDGGVYLLSQKFHSAIAGVEKTVFDSSRGLFLVVSIKPNGVSPVSFSPANVRATIDGKPVKLLSYDELMANAESERSRRSFGVKLQQFANSIGTNSDGYSTSTYQSTTQGYIQGRNGPIMVQGQTTGTITSYDPAAAARAQAQFQENMRKQSENIDADYSDKVASLKYALRSQTVPAGGMGLGIVQVDASISSSVNTILRVEIDVDNETHEFRMTLIPKKP